ncbi:MAG: transporter substrate-binding domain-containing protein, partial [Pseudomonadota bacterium]
MRTLLILICLTTTLLTQGVGAQTLTAATVTRPPFSMNDGDADAGFSMELLAALAETLDWDYQVRRYDVFSDMLDAVETGDADLAIANISITAARETRMDFSQP